MGLCLLGKFSLKYNLGPSRGADFMGASRLLRVDSTKVKKNRFSDPKIKNYVCSGLFWISNGLKCEIPAD